MKITIILEGSGGELDRQTIEVHPPNLRPRRGELQPSSTLISARIIEALRAWTIAPGDTIRIEESAS